MRKRQAHTRTTPIRIYALSPRLSPAVPGGPVEVGVDTAEDLARQLLHQPVKSMLLVYHHLFHDRT